MTADVRVCLRLFNQVEVQGKAQKGCNGSQPPTPTTLQGAKSTRNLATQTL